MAVSSGKKARRVSTNVDVMPTVEAFHEVKPLNFIQGVYLDAIKSSEVIFGIGSAGTGKTYVSVGYAASQLYHRKVDQVILTRPNVETGPSLGFIPGDIEEKYAPYLDPFDSTFRRLLGKGFYEYCLKSKTIEPKPLGFLRGATFDNCVVLVDEVQNMTKVQIKMLLSRIGKNCRIILSGDPSQSDIPNSGLDDAVKRLDGIEGIEIVNFLDSDIVRSRMCKQIIMAYNK